MKIVVNKVLAIILRYQSLLFFPPEIFAFLLWIIL